MKLLLAFLALTAIASATPGDRCVGCHPEQVEGYLETGMGRSISQPAQQPSGSFLHAASSSSLTISSTTAGMLQRISRGGLSAEQPVDFVIGSGNAAFGYLVRIGDALFQSPIAFYSRRERFDVAPGMETFREPDFNRPATPECLWCHSGRPLPVAGAINRYQDEVFAAAAISCDRCHGPATGHLRAPSASNIVNPAKLEPARRDSVCEQCHLSGEARVLNPGSDYGDFRPGMLLEEVLSVYVFDHETAGDFKVVSHSEQLRRSQCYQANAGEMWCGDVPQSSRETRRRRRLLPRPMSELSWLPRGGSRFQLARLHRLSHAAVPIPRQRAQRFHPTIRFSESLEGKAPRN